MGRRSFDQVRGAEKPVKLAKMRQICGFVRLIETVLWRGRNTVERCCHLPGIKACVVGE
jgi:hypothetical protein